MANKRVLHSLQRAIGFIEIRERSKYSGFIHALATVQHRLELDAQQVVTINNPLFVSHVLYASVFSYSFESGTLENPVCEPPQGMYEMTVDAANTPDVFDHLQIDFKRGKTVRQFAKNFEEYYRAYF